MSPTHLNRVMEHHLLRPAATTTSKDHQRRVVLDPEPSDSAPRASLPSSSFLQRWWSSITTVVLGGEGGPGREWFMARARLLRIASRCRRNPKGIRLCLSLIAGCGSFRLLIENQERFVTLLIIHLFNVAYYCSLLYGLHN